ncbi:MAG: penicillin-binding transpeptidase domain-containing protein [Bacteroidetes bacterium]|nr:penicillin-binding transpeptidase domain-containing protein [Bacteroidota bacterium]
MSVRDQTIARMYGIFAVLALLPLIIAGQMVWLNIAQGDYLREIGWTQVESQEILPAHRGEILDIHGRALAVNSPLYKLALDPLTQGFDDEKTFFLLRLADLTGKSIAKLQTQIDERSSPQYVRLADLTYDQRKEVYAWDVPGVILEERPQRQYVYGTSFSHILGRVDLDGVGIAGLEMEYDQYLTGRPGRRTLFRDRRGYRRIDVEGLVVPPVDGESLVLTIDLIRQTIMEEELVAGVAEAGALRGSAIAVEPSTGAILALANVPAYNANAPMQSAPSAWRNTAITDVLEPGSAFKMIAATAALEAGYTTMDRLVDTGDGSLQIAQYTLNDINPYGELTFNDVIVKSSNVGMALTTSPMRPEELYEYIRNFGFGEKTWIDLPGEVTGLLKRTDRWSQTTKTALSIGYEINVTPLQMVMAYAALADGGLLRQPYIVAERRDVTGQVLWRATDDRARTDSIRRVLDLQTAKMLVPALVDVVERGTATAANMKDVKVAGKSGTARKTVGGGYGSEYRSTFVGFYPADNPMVAMIVILDEPQTSIFGGRVAAPIFRRIAERWAVTFSTTDSPSPEYDWQQTLFRRASETWADESSPTTQTDDQPVVPDPILSEYDTAVMPSVIGLDARTAHSLLSSKGITVRFNGTGSVIDQTPAPGDPTTNEALLQLQKHALEQH